MLLNLSSFDWIYLNIGLRPFSCWWYAPDGRYTGKVHFQHAMVTGLMPLLLGIIVVSIERGIGFHWQLHLRMDLPPSPKVRAASFHREGYSCKSKAAFFTVLEALSYNSTIQHVVAFFKHVFLKCEHEFPKSRAVGRK